jgi:hypothetical protein
VFVCVLAVIDGIAGIGVIDRSYAESGDPAKAEIEKSFSSNGVRADQDVMYRSPDGFVVLVPAGYEYTALTSGPMRLVAKRKTDVLAVGKISASSGLEVFVPEVRKHLAKQLPTHTFSDPVPVRVNNVDAMRLESQYVQDGVLRNDVMVFFKPTTDVFELVLTCPRDSLDAHAAEYNKVIGSFRVTQPPR